MTAKAQASIEISANPSKLGEGLRRAKAQFAEFSSAIARGTSGAFKAVSGKMKLGDAGKNAAGHFGGELMTRGFDALTGAAGDVRNFERALVRLGIAGDLSAGKLGAIKESIRATSKATGIADDQILNGAQTYIDLTGDVKGAQTAMTSFARIAQASGAATSDVATATAALQMSMKLDSSQVEAAFSGLIVQGKGGAVSVKDFAGELATLAPQFAQFKGGTGLAGIREMGAGFQVIRIGAGSAAEASTQFQALMGEIGKSGKELSKIGIDVFEKDGKSLRGASAIFEDIAKNKQLASVSKMEAIFGRKESQAAVRSIREHIDKFRELKAAGEDTGAVQRDLAKFLESDAGRMDAAFNRVKVTIAEAFTPERIAAFVNAIEGLADKIGPIVDAVGKIGDGLGTLYGAGQKIRGAFSSNENQNPFGDGSNSSRMDDLKWIAEGGTDEHKHARAVGVVSNDLNRKAYNDSVSSILGGEVNERSTPESIKRAVLAKNSTRAVGTGRIGESYAGATYLKNAGIDDKKAEALLAGYKKEAFTEIVGAIRAGFTGVGAGQHGLAAVEVKVGDNVIAKSAAKATEPRRAPPK